MTAKFTPKFPERIWAIESGVPVHFRVSCSIIEHGPEEGTEYVRGDIYASLKTELAQIDDLLSEGQGDDDGMQIMPDFEPGMTTLAKIEACTFLLEKRRDVIEALMAENARLKGERK